MKETQKKPKEKQLLDHDTVSRSNVLIESKSSTSLFERKLLNRGGCSFLVHKSPI